MDSLQAVKNVAEPIRAIKKLELQLSDMEQYDFPLEHFFPKGLYGRKIFMPAGSVIVSKVHKYEHLTIALTGHAQVVSEDGTHKDIIAPAVFITQPGTQRALYIVEDAIWLTVHATDVKTVEDAESILVTDSIENYLASTKKWECLP